MRTAQTTYGDELRWILAQGPENEWMPLAGELPVRVEVEEKIRGLGAKRLFPGARHPEAALSGLWLYFSQLDASHKISQTLHTPEGSFWHGIMHRREPDAGNAGYWFRKVNRHEVFPALWATAGEAISRYPGLSYSLGKQWDPFVFIEYCENARQRPGSDEEKLAMELQMAEWQILFDYCAGPAR
ncbi:MAG: hypothetical protein JJE04_07245 [Acidobacteriia bacterium]|nr:hypothetical protein [Terriglobia bacterium]